MSNTGFWKGLLIEIVLNLIMPYPFLNDLVYYEEYIDGDFNVTLIEFRVNSLLLCLMTFIRLYQIGKCLLILTYWTHPRA